MYNNVELLVEEINEYLNTHPDISEMSLGSKIIYILSGRFFREIDELRDLLSHLEYELRYV